MAGDVSADRVWRDRVRGCLLGGAIGDAVGAPFEGWPEVDGARIDRHIDADTMLTWTDDTALQMAVAEYLAELDDSSSFDDDAHARGLALAWQWAPDRGYGVNPPHVFRAVLAGEDWRASATEAFGGTGSLGNGGAMRSAPLGTLPVDPTAVADLARRMAAVTHAHPVGKDGAAATAVAAWNVLRWRGAEDVDASALMSECRAHLGTDMVREAVSAVLTTLAVDDPAEVAQITGNGVAAHETVGAALSAFLHHPHEPLAAIRFAVLMGGDTDTVAAVAGSLSGAAAGADALPRHLLERLEDRDRIERVSDELAARTAPAPDRER